MVSFRYPFTASSFYFVEYWNDKQKEEAAKILNRNLKSDYIRNVSIDDMVQDCVVYLLSGQVRVRRKESTDSVKRKIVPSDLINFINKTLRRKYMYSYSQADLSSAYEASEINDPIFYSYFEKAIGKLAEIEKHILLNTIEGKSKKEIANVLNMHFKSIGYQKKKALGKISYLLAE